MKPEPYLKLYISVLDEAPDFIVPTLVAHSVLNAHLKFSGHPIYEEWLQYSFKKVVLSVNRKAFEKIKTFDGVHLGHENTTLGGAPSCAVVMPVMSDNVPNVLKYSKLWTPK